MKQLMKIIGMELVKTGTHPDGRDGIVKLMLIPYENIKLKKRGIMQIAMGGVDEMINELTQNQQFKSEIYISQKDWLQEFKNQPYTNVNVDIVVDKFAIDIAKEGL